MLSFEDFKVELCRAVIGGEGAELKALAANIDDQWDSLWALEALLVAEELAGVFRTSERSLSTVASAYEYYCSLLDPVSSLT